MTPKRFKTASYFFRFFWPKQPLLCQNRPGFQNQMYRNSVRLKIEKVTKFQKATPNGVGGIQSNPETILLFFMK